MNYLTIVKNIAYLAATILCATRISLAAVRRTTASEITEISRSNEASDVLRTIQPEKEFIIDEKAAKIAEKEMIDVSHELLSPFASYPFFPFHFPKLRREANSTEKLGHIEKEPSKKPFFYVDFEFNIEKIPLKNQSRDNIMDQPRKGSPLEMLDDWPFFDDSPSLESDMEEFPPRSDLFSFDFPFHRRHGKTLGQNNRNSPKSVSSVVDILDNSMKRDMEPILDLASAKESDNLLDGNKIGSIVKDNPYDILHRKAPVVLGKVVKIGEIRFGEDYSKGRKRRKTSTLGKKGNKGIQETSIELIRMDEPKLTPLKDVFRRVHEFSGLSPKVDSEVIRLNNRDGKELDAKTDDKTQMYSAAVKDRSLIDNDLTYVQQETYHEDPMRDSIGFEILKPHSPFSRIRRQEVTQENATVPKEEISRNITHVLGEFFSLMKKLHNSKLFYREKENQENDEVHCPALSGLRESGLYVNHDSSNGRRMPRNSSNEESSRKVADLVYLFLTVTLPTVLAFTLLLVACYVNLRLRGWLCTKLFQPRNVYVVERDVEKTGKETLTLKEVNRNNTRNENIQPLHKEKREKSVARKEPEEEEAKDEQFRLEMLDGHHKKHKHDE